MHKVYKKVITSLNFLFDYPKRLKKHQIYFKSQHRVICSMLLRKLTKQYCNKKKGSFMISSLQQFPRMFTSSKNWHLTVPGFSSEDKQHHSEHMPTMMEASPKAEISTSSITKETVRPGLGDHVGSNDIIEPPISEELASPSNDQI
ncbi:uncharacterized protein LOC107876067 isoform X4 [Capsicum annuum]|uniref:uncharacterized protein LOC107876067 isoform X4 n=1 Tax=Capsicum annuum TaxID=4072 RepID=UPI0007BF5FB2|nr:uncharacterized protein LOC107876067 isoform X4 [Capsicum annuum]